MPFGTTRTDVEFVANVGRFRADMGEIRAQYARTTGAMSEESLRAAVAQEKLDRAIHRSGAESLRAKEATLVYRREIEALRRDAERTASTVARVHGGGRGGGFFGRGSTLRHEEREAGRAGRGLLAGGFREHGARALAFGSTAFLGGFGAAYAVDTVITAAIEHQKALGQLQIAVKDTGLSYAHLRGEIGDTLERQQQLGFTFDESTKAFNLALRATGSIAGANRLLAASSDVARGSGKGLLQSTLLLSKAYHGSVGGLRRVGIFVDKGAKGWDAIGKAQAKYTGAAVRYSNSAAGAQERLHNSIRETEAAIGTALLPTITHLSTGLSHWLTQSKNQKRIQHDVNSVLKVGTEAVHGIAGAYRTLAPPVRAVNRALGGTTHSVKLLAIALIALKLRNVATGFGLVRARSVAAGAGAAASMAKAERGVVGLRGALGRLTATPYLITFTLVAIGAERIAQNIKNLQQGYLDAQSHVAGAKSGVRASLVPHLADEIRKKRAAGEGGKQIIAELRQQLGGDTDIANQMIGDAFAYDSGSGDVKRQVDAIRHKPGQRDKGPGAQTPPKRKPYELTEKQRIALALAKNPDDVAALRAKLAADQRAEAFAQKRIAQGRGSKDLVQSLIDVRGDEDSIRSHLQELQDADARKREERVRKAAAETRKRAAAKKAAERKTIQERQRRLKRLTEVPVALRLEEANAKAHSAGEKRLVAIYEQEKKALEQQLVHLRKIGASKELKAKNLQAEARVQAKIDALTKKKKTKSKGDAQDAAQIVRDATSTLQEIIRNESNVRQAPQVIVNQHFPHPPTVDGRREARYAQVAGMAAWS